MAVFRQVAIGWKGETYYVTPSHAMLRRIEMQGVSIAGLINDFQAGQPKLFVVAFVMSELLKAAGADVSEAEVGSVLMGSQDEQKVMALLETFIQAVVPSPESVPGNVVAPSETDTDLPK